MAYLNVDLDYFEHRKTKRLVGRLGKNAEVLPLKLWSYCGKFHSEDGRLTGYSETEIASIVAWWREPMEFIQAMLDVCYMGKDDTGYYVHEWREHQGHLKAFRERAKKGAATRWAKLVGSDGDATSMPQACDKHSSSNAPTKPTTPTEPTTPIDESSTAAGPDPANSLAGELGIGFNLNDKWRGELRRVIAIDGVQPVRLAILDALAKGVGSPACISYAEKIIIGQKAKKTLRESSKRAVTAVREDN
jgi:hypothetical protein